MEKRIVLLGLLVAVFLSMYPSNAMADPATPDALQILDVEVFRHIIEDDDYLLVFLYNIEYASPPDDSANDLFLFRLTDAGDTLGDSLPYSFGMDGYQYGVSGMYFSAADAPTWAELYTVRIDGNPTVWASPPTVTYTMIATDYSSAATQDEAQDELVAWLVDATQDIEQNWDVPGELITLTNIGTVFTAAGQHYFLGAIQGCMAMAPDLFAVKYHDVEWEEETWTDQRADDTTDRFDGTMLDDLKESLSDIAGGIDAIYVTSVVTIIGVLVLMGLSFVKWGSTDPVYGLLPLVLLLGSKIDFFPWELYGLICFACAAYSGWILIGKYASG